MTSAQNSNQTTANADLTGVVVGVLGGTGDQGRGLALRLAQAGVEVIIGSRDAARAHAAASEVGHGVIGVDNVECAQRGDIVIVAVPWDGHRATVEGLVPHLEGKILIDCVNPLGFDKQGAFALAIEEGSAAQQAQALVPGARVVAAFNNVSAVLLLDEGVERIETDVFVVGDDRDATDRVQALVDLIPGMRGIYAGRLRNAHQIEALTANLISVNRRYKAHAGVRVTDV